MVPPITTAHRVQPRPQSRPLVRWHQGDSECVVAPDSSGCPGSNLSARGLLGTFFVLVGVVIGACFLSLFLLLEDPPATVHVVRRRGRSPGRHLFWRGFALGAAAGIVLGAGVVALARVAGGQL